MKILLIDGGHISFVLGRKLTSEGHEVWSTADNSYPSTLYCKAAGYVPDYGNVLADDWDLVVVGSAGASRRGVADHFRVRGIPTIGASWMAFRAEEQKDIGRRIFDEAGFPSVRYWRFEDGKAAVAGIPSLPIEKCVVKFLKSESPHRTFVCESREDAVDAVTFLDNSPLIVEEFIDGIEIAFSCYYDGKSIAVSCTNFEHKHLWPGDRGILTSEMGTLLFHDDIPAVRHLFELILGTRSGSRYLSGYRGWFDMNTIVDRKTGEIYPLELTMRFGTPTIDIMTALESSSQYGEFLLSVAEGRMGTLAYRDAFAAGAVMVVCGFPYQSWYPEICRVGSPIRGLEKLSCHYSLGGVARRGDKLVTSKAWVMCITGIGETLTQARGALYDDVAKLSFQDMVYRDDIGRKFAADRHDLLNHGLISRSFAERGI